MLARGRRAARGSGGFAPPILYFARRGFGGARSGRESRLTDRTGKQALRGRGVDVSIALSSLTIASCEPFVTEPLGGEIVWLPVSIAD